MSTIFFSFFHVSLTPKEWVISKVANNWQKFEQNFVKYFITSRLSRESNISASLFLATIEKEAYDIYDGLRCDCEDKMDLMIVIKKFKEFFVGEMHEAYESYQFHLRKQEASERSI